MNKQVALFYFSGTGNTKIVVDLVQKAFSEHQVDTMVYNIEDTINNDLKYNLDKFDMIGIAHPIYGFGSPTIVDQFAKSLPALDGIKTFIFKTAGDFLKINHNASRRLITRLSKKGYNVFYDRIICMGSNFYMPYDDALVKELYESAVSKVSHMVGELLSGTSRLYDTGLFMRLMTNMMNDCEDKFFARLFGKSLKVTDDCIHCNKCIKNCPSNNIYLKDGKIKFRFNCYLCMRCIYACPTKAIKSSGSNFVILKDGYDINKIIASGDTNESTNQKLSDHFKNYLADPTL